MKTISQIAKEENVTPQAIYKRLNKLKTKLTPYLTKDENGKTLIDSVGEAILKGSLSQEDTLGSKPVDNQSSQLDDNQMTTKFNVFLQDQIRVKDQTITDLIQQNTDLIKKIENMQVLLKAEQELKSLPILDMHQESQEAKRNIFQRLFSRKTKHDS